MFKYVHLQFMNNKCSILLANKNLVNYQVDKVSDKIMPTTYIFHFLSSASLEEKQIAVKIPERAGCL